jgi:hypothetical protein
MELNSNAYSCEEKCMAGVKITTTYSNNSNSNNSDNGNELHVLNVWPSKDSFNLRGVAHDPTMHARRGVTPGALWGGGGGGGGGTCSKHVLFVGQGYLALL